MADIRIRIRIDDDDELTALEEAAGERPDLQTEVVTESTGDVDAAIAPIVAVLVAGAAAAWLSELVWEWINRARGGLVIDLRPDAADTFSRDRDLPYGTVLTYPADGGSATFDTTDAPEGVIERLLTAVIEGTLKNAKDLVAAAKEALGGDKVKENAATPAG